MAATYSFDVTSNIDMPEVDNAVNQARKEIGQRFDFKGSIATIELDQKANTLTLTAEDNFKLTALWEIVQTRLVRRNVPTENLTRGTVQPAATGTEARTGQPQLVVVQSVRNDEVPAKKSTCARQRLEEQFRQTFLQQHPRSELATARIGINNEPATTVNGRTS